MRRIALCSTHVDSTFHPLQTFHRMKSSFQIPILILIFCNSLRLTAQEQPKQFGISFNGYVKTDFFTDTRQGISIREGHFLLFPAPEVRDASGTDINDAPSMNFLSIQTRLTGTISAPDAFGAKTRGVIEADFFGNENAAFVDANGFRLRHAYVALKWESGELLAGQYWHPLFVARCFSDVISFNTGAPFQPFSRNPQIRYTQMVGPFSLFAAASAQRDFASPGGSLSQRNAALPAMHAMLQFERKSDDASSDVLAGIGGGYSVLRPLLQTESGTKKYSADATVAGLTATAFALWKSQTLTLKAQALYGQNTFDLTMLGGYAVSKVVDSMKNSVEYTPLATASLWTECMYTWDMVQFAVWGGYTQNLGAADPIAFYSNKVKGTDATIRGADIKSIWRLSPRIVVTAGKMSFALETEYTSVAYAATNASGVLERDDHGVITSSNNIANLRVLLAAILKF